MRIKVSISYNIFVEILINNYFNQREPTYNRFNLLFVAYTQF